MTALARLKTRSERRKRRREPPSPPAPPPRHVAKIAPPAHDETPTAADNT